MVASGSFIEFINNLFIFKWEFIIWNAQKNANHIIQHTNCHIPGLIQELQLIIDITIVHSQAGLGVLEARLWV